MGEPSNFEADIDIIGRIEAVPAILDVVCLTIGMEFAAVARVTQERWVACSVRNSIQLGIKPGDELKIGTTLCNTIRDTREIIAIDNVSEDECYANHPTPAMYGFQSYISAPIVLPDGTFFGTLCAIDPKPRVINTPQTIGMLKLFAELIAFHVDAHQRLVASTAELHQLGREHKQFRQAERMANVGSWRLVLTDQRVEWSEQVFAIHELPVGDMPTNESALDFYPPHARAEIAAAVERTIEAGQPFDVETDIITAKGNKRRVRSIGELELFDGKPIAIIGVFQDVTAQYILEQSLKRVASIDDLTQIPNRAKFNQILAERIEEAREQNGNLALLLIDLDGFKMVNDLCGHLTGDDLLRLIGSKLRASYLSNCFVARLGGDEFVVIVSAQEDCSDLDSILKTLLSDLCHSIDYGSGVLRVSGTIGVSWLDETVQSRSELLQRADTALYAAKKTQRGSAKVFAHQGLTFARPRPARLLTG